MTNRSATARWQGSLKEGGGSVGLGTGAIDAPISFSSRFEEGEGTNPEELIAAAHAGCFSMKFAGDLGKAGFSPEQVTTTANVRLEKLEAGFTITKIELVTRAKVGGGIDEARFQEIARQSKDECPVSRALAAVSEITVDATLV